MPPGCIGVRCLMSLERFKTAQDASQAGFATALAELRAGRKTSHWIWYVFPQLAGLGHSSTARFYALQDIAEARDYLGDPILQERLLLAAEAVAEKLGQGIPITRLMSGTTDALKLISSVTLFQLATEAPGPGPTSPAAARIAASCEKILRLAEQQGFARCPSTLAQCQEV